MIPNLAFADSEQTVYTGDLGGKSTCTIVNSHAGSGNTGTWYSYDVAGGAGDCISQVGQNIDVLKASVNGLALSTTTSVNNLATGLNTTNNNLSSLAASVAPLTGAAYKASLNNESIGGTLTGGGVGGVVGTQGKGINNQSLSLVVSSTLGVANGYDTTAAGVGANAGTINGVNGATQTVSANGATAYGAYSLAQDTNTTAMGFRATALQTGSSAVGYQSQALGAQSIAIGANSNVATNAANGVAIGANASVTAANSVALGSGSVASESNTISVGSAGNERRITNVAPGVIGTDAVNLNQLSSAQQQMSSQLKDVERQAYSGTALAMAMGGTYLPSLEAGKKSISMGMGNYKGYTAIGVNYKQMDKAGKVSWGTGLSTTGKAWGFNAGVGYEWE